MSFADRHAQALELTAAAGADVLLCADPANVHWLTGLACEIETGPSPFAPGPLVLLSRGEPVRLIVSDDELPATLPEGVATLSYEGFTTGPLDGPRHAQRLVGEALDGRTPVTDQFDGLGPALLDARAVKDALALAELRRALAVADAGQAALRAIGDDAIGASEIELFSIVRGAMEASAGTRVPVLADLVSAPRTASMGGAPSDRLVHDGELILCDLAPRVGGVWGDSCATIAVGEPPAAARAAHARVTQALDRAIDAVRPGVDAAALDRIARGADLDYPHHSGHGIGSSYHEQPRLVPSATGSLREGMVIALEPASYAETFGVRLEHVVRVTADGCEVLSRHRLELS
ncbi:Xaa-Pro peptidase family protein [Conexibacter sp. JD483]|uniref:M24 family metallopeptidase n=1 Tax=unclassified Conexibacter TaxID=2627773 RepID=UPI00271ADCF2|nr:MULTISPECIES: Xaa-Pro peptidase family protein [unclassified Conexibacter]MDO8186574.1 Xaa-Pro peptidase family protein [Conexibacter sp. CPCC 205706]MDO8196679.1 Xaa-Pro peptidase family protein [Conexibacter sp. CPCC 205762]MDR9372053.1 Xaa-Pro peptidase family protein [Conexibacter sp. JD483]